MDSGRVRVISSTDFPEERFEVGSELALFKEDGTKPIIVKVASHRKHKNFNLINI